VTHSLVTKSGTSAANELTKGAPRPTSQTQCSQDSWNKHSRYTHGTQRTRL